MQSSSGSSGGFSVTIRRRPPRRFLAAIAVLAGLAGSGASAASGDDPFLTDLGPTRPTAAWAAFCAAAPDECRTDRREPTFVRYTDEVWRTIVRVNRQVNRSIRAVTDAEHWGVSDRWDFPTDGLGDCEDIQIEKRRLLQAAGIPARAMRMAMVINPENEGHAVLVVRTDRGDFVLDNRVSAVLPWYDTGYVWVKREGDSATAWVSLGGVRGPIETAGP